MFLDLSFVLVLLTATIFYLVAQMVKNLPTMWETWVLSLGQKDPLEKEMATHSSILAWRIPWTEEPDRLQSMGCKESDTIEWLFNALLLDNPSLCPHVVFVWATLFGSSTWNSPAESLLLSNKPCPPLPGPGGKAPWDVNWSPSCLTSCPGSPISMETCIPEHIFLISSS